MNTLIGEEMNDEQSRQLNEKQSKARAWGWLAPLTRFIAKVKPKRPMNNIGPAVVANTNVAAVAVPKFAALQNPGRLPTIYIRNPSQISRDL